MSGLQKARPGARRRNVGVTGARVAIRGYQLVPKVGPPRCRFYPSCSNYAMQALEEYGLLRGAWLAARRLARCHPFHPGGIDEVPARATDETRGAQSGEEPA